MKVKIKLAVLFLTAILGHQYMQAVRAYSRWADIQQPDGTTLKAMLCGDEWLHYYITTDGIPLVLGNDGRSLCYADCIGFGLSNTGILAHEAAQRSESEQLLLATTGTIASVQRYAAQARATADSRRALRKATFSGNYKGLIILVSFPDRDFSSEAPQELYSRMLNEEGFSMNDAPGSVHDYFLAQSYGKFNITFDVVGPIKASGLSTEYGDNYKVRSSLVPEITRAAAQQVNLKDYDWNKDGEMEQVIFIYAGYTSSDYYPEEPSTAKAKDCIWPHEWTLSSPTTIGGVKINTYACSNELWINDKLAGFGTLCHEFSHCLGLPDLYDVKYNESVSSTGGIMDKWDLMDGGNYCHAGWVPCGYSGYERIFCGWTTATELTAPTSVSNLQALSNGGDIYKIVNDCQSSRIQEFYILENRQKQGWDSYLPGHGLLITHVDYSASNWSGNTVNDDLSHLRQVFIPADNDLLCYYYYGNSPRNAAYPYINTEKGICNDSLTNNSVPAAKVYNKNRNGNYLMNKPVTHITEANKLVSFDFMGGDPSAIHSSSAASHSSSSTTKTYDLSGRMANSHKSGIVISAGRKELKR